MISKGSLAAFSAAVLNGSTQVSGVRPMPASTASRAPVQAAPGGGGGAARPTPSVLPLPPAPGQPLPRGSLLDLSV